ncbi:MAG TPA: hypothetical protein VHA80_13325 [Solirubrobacterales bacterium]|nr:hypothetical protein [Solirubrobacterales bacterium]
MVATFDSATAAVEEREARAGRRTGGVAGNARLTAAVAVVLFLLLAAEGLTIPFIGKWLGPHLFIGLLLVPAVALKLASTGFRFVRYYTHDAAYVRKGPPPIVPRLLAPGVVLTTLAVFATGVALLLVGPPGDTLILVHKVSFIAWVAFMSLHVLGHLLELPRLASADWRRHGQREARLAGAGLRAAALALAIVAGVALGFLALSVGGPWL